MMQVIRWEAENGVGIYYDSGVIFSVPQKEVRGDNHPTPEEDFGTSVHEMEKHFFSSEERTYEHKSVIFGFISEEQETAWFSKKIQKRFLKGGAVRKVFEVPEDRVKWTSRQAVFDPYAATLISETQLDGDVIKAKML